ncbi:MAG: hypothetical protein ACTJHT_04800 [Sphingobacterium sp.]|uniref:hypothetical protein n=1 Tax=Sphingobacterium sp. JB170 TaxID=1434842 RepID=UPI00097EFE43|nr:hypothetical protein [Sphingobacterium sp. JB170]SJN15691.1 hypothetical protein FM107_00100 [Sphingobacterium sp. JB170]
MKIIHILTAALICLSGVSLGQVQQEHISKLELGKKKKKYFNSRDSSAIIYIDTLIMKDKSSMQFIGKTDVKLVVKYAKIGKKVFISGSGAKNNASNFDIEINLQSLGSLYVIAKGLDALNGSRTNDNGDGGKVTFRYAASGVTPQTTDKKAANYLRIDVTPGGRTTNPTTDLNQIYSRIKTAPSGLRGVPQGQIYSGSPGREGEVTLEEKL